MQTATIITGAVALLGLLLAVALVVVLVRQRRAHEREITQLTEAARRDHDQLAARLDDLAQSQELLRSRATSAGLLITDAGEIEDPRRPEQVPDGVVVSATLGAPLVKAAATAHGVRRALSAESRNRIWFEMRREVRRARKQRRREMRAAWRDVRTRQEHVA